MLERAWRCDKTDLVREFLRQRGDQRVDVAKLWYSVMSNREYVPSVVDCLLQLDDDRRIEQAQVQRAVTLVINRITTPATQPLFEKLINLRGARRVDVRAQNNKLFVNACKTAPLRCVELLLRLEGDRSVDVHARNGQGFVNACQRPDGFGVAKMLLDLTGHRRIDVHAQDDRAFVTACRYGRADVVELLLSLDGDRTITFDSNDAFVEACGSGCSSVVAQLLQGEGKAWRQFNFAAVAEQALSKACR